MVSVNDNPNISYKEFINELYSFLIENIEHRTEENIVANDKILKHFFSYIGWALEFWLSPNDVSDTTFFIVEKENNTNKFKTGIYAVNDDTFTIFNEEVIVEFKEAFDKIKLMKDLSLILKENEIKEPLSKI